MTVASAWRRYTMRWRTRCQPPAGLAAVGLLVGTSLSQPRLPSLLLRSSRPPTMMAAVQQQPPTLSALSLDDLVPGSLAALQAHVGRVGVAVMVPSRGVLYLANGDAAFPLASVVKVPIMLATLDRRPGGGAELDPDEEALLSAMITESDNDAASNLWTVVGGGDGVAGFVRAQALDGFSLDSGGEWGESAASARAVAMLLAGLLQPGMLAAAQQSEALALLGQVVPEQRWGVSAGVPANAYVGLKNGWYPADTGWRVHSAGLVLPGGGGPGYAVVIFTDGQPDLSVGIATIEHLAGQIHAALSGTGQPVEPHRHPDAIRSSTAP